ncbi:MAG: hypothetical protein UW32_C0001G0027 [Candidatus Wolfebacteria bacterium GW2011_GWE2_44_13]|uniref:Uncharacterized protein n=1 Tax=Candidatus Wolfebacteria bacterium GW2011_GWE2_44_13 TaxID=1619017 RepID=A0A0G1H9H3_9BACT|nr:MAG: hypothetical protein UW32_C0001G0027 [Candidatus Wolfebacteria bacterium GW2011_GWE2_44_13]
MGCWQGKFIVGAVATIFIVLLYPIIMGWRLKKKCEVVGEVQEKHISYIQIESGSVNWTCEWRLTVGWGEKEKATMVVDGKLYDAVRHASKVLVRYEVNGITGKKKALSIEAMKLP